MDRRNKTPSNKSGRRFFIRPSRTMSRASSMDNNGSGGINGVDDDGTGGNRVFANETEARQWRELGSHVQRLRAVVNGARGRVDGAYEEYRKMSGACGEIYKAVLGGGAGLARVEAGGGGRGVTVEEWVQAVRQWQAGVEGLAKALRNGLVASIALCEGDGAERVFEAMVYDGRVRSQVVNRMRTASLQSIRSKGAGHFDKFLLRLGFYNVVQREVGELTRLVHAAQAAQGRRVETITVWPGGDAVLEFAGDEEEIEMDSKMEMDSEREMEEMEMEIGL
ncbi:hypothetical protein CDD82_3052 [Ophiocordyceps australis]|uniref:Uncharacterized protein n=1 Tax=Ophiocordyceps australis TaxID=1399860 RepID=A0A2C5ZFD8_9HYPO|nr:hypothetical protein CDD82_3052 [Ophiocordyceps australis]